MPPYPWYGRHDKDKGIDQGIILTDFPVLDFEDVKYSDLASEEDVEIPIKSKKADLIVMTQACDLENDKVSNITLCRIYTLKEYIAEAKLSATKARDLVNSLNSDRVANMFMLQKPEPAVDEDSLSDLLVVKFDESFNYPVSLVRQRVDNEENTLLKLLPPYREALSQAYGNFFMRIGNPNNRDSAQFENYRAFIASSQ